MNDCFLFILKYNTDMSLRHKYLCQKSKAKHRGIDWNLSFDEWLYIWEQSGHLALRGCSIGKYCMSRKNDTGPYSADNVFIQLWTKNTSDAHKGQKIKKARTAEYRAKQKLSHANPVIVMGKEYTSMNEASKQLGISRYTIKKIATKKGT
jgi:hypothetical protein